MKKILFITLLASSLFAFGCAKKQVSCTTEPEKPVQVQEQITQPEPQPVVEPEPAPKVVQPTPMEIYESTYASLPTEHKVVKGECLWWIAEYKQIYNDPFMWPLIYKANRDRIKNPDLIYPSQIFTIPRDFTLDELKKSRRQAGAPKPYLPPETANLPARLRAELGWNF
jgi:LysM repeat protein